MSRFALGVLFLLLLLAFQAQVLRLAFARSPLGDDAQPATNASPAAPGAAQPAGNVSPAGPGATNASPAAPTATNGSPVGPSATNASPTAPVINDPASVTFPTDVGLLLVAVKPDKVADYEAAIVALQEALSRVSDPEKRAIAEGWRVFKVIEVDAKSNALYVHLLQPALPGTDYRPSMLLDELLDGAPDALLAKYREAFAGPPSKLALIEFAHMSVAPVPKAEGNASPRGPTGPQKPGNKSPDAP